MAGWFDRFIKRPTASTQSRVSRAPSVTTLTQRKSATSVLSATDKTPASVVLSTIPLVIPPESKPVSRPVSSLESAPVRPPPPGPAPILDYPILSQNLASIAISPPPLEPPHRSSPTPVPEPSTTDDSRKGATTLGLWAQALEKLRKKGLRDIDCVGGGDIQLIQRLIAEAETKQKECNSKRLFYKNSCGEEIYYADAFFKQLNKYALIGDIAIQHHPDVVALAWSGFRLLLQVGTAYTENMAMVSDGLEYLVTVIFCGEIYERLYSKLAQAEPLKRTLVDLYALVLEYLWRAKIFLENGTAVRILESFSSELNKILGSIQETERVARSHADLAEKAAASVSRSDQGARAEHLGGLLTEIQESIQKIGFTVVESYRKIEGIWEYVEKKKRQEILEWISDVKYGSHHSEFRDRRHVDTGVWLLQNPTFHDWDVSDTSRIFWLRGDAGSGKTMLASKVIDRFQEKEKVNQTALAYFYCYFQESARSDPASVLRALVKQLCIAYSEQGLPKQIVSIYNDRERGGHSTGSLSLNESGNLITELLKRFSHTTIVVDALDECNQKTRGGMFQIIEKIAKSENVKLFLTSRNEGDIREVLFSMPNHYIDAKDNSEDINKYIKAEVSLLRIERPLLHIDTVLENQIVSALQDGAHGMFMWAHLQILAIRSENTAEDIRAALQSLPEDLNTAYNSILQRIENQSKISLNRALMVLKWGLCAHGVFSPEMISQALLFESRSTTLSPPTNQLLPLPVILDICRNLVVYDKELNVLRFAHFSAKEFLFDQPQFSQQEIHTSIAELCLAVLCQESSYKDSKISDLVDYATLNWAAHVRMSGAGSSKLQQLWKEFLQHSSLGYREWTKSAILNDTNKDLQTHAGVMSPLWVACYYQLYDIFGSLLDSGLEPEPYNGAKQTPLAHAAKHGYKEVVQMLLRTKGVDVNCKNENHRTSLSLAAQNGHQKVVEMLLGMDWVDVDCKDSSNRTPLSFAAENGHQKVVEMLLAMDGVDVNCEDENHQTPLLYAAKNKHEKIVEMLLVMDGVDVNCEDKSKRTLLSLAAERGDEKVVAMLLAIDGVDVNCEDKSKRTPLSFAAERGHDKVVAMLLAMDGVDVESGDHWSRTPLSYAVEYGYEKVVEILLAKDRSDTDRKYGVQGTLLEMASIRGDEKVVEMLFEKAGVSVNQKEIEIFLGSEMGITAILWTAKHGLGKMLQILLSEDGADLNSKGEDGMTALLWAAKAGHGQAVQILLDMGADMNIRDRNGVLPISWAAKSDHGKVVDILWNKRKS